MQLTNFTATGGSTVNISLSGIIQEQLGSMESSMIEAYSYLDNAFQFLVDYSNSSNLTELTPMRNVTTLTGTSATASDLRTLHANILTVTIKTPAITVLGKIDLEVA